MGYLAMAGHSTGLLHVVNTGAPGIAYKTACLQESILTEDSFGTVYADDL
jgi:hypothetical protein